MTISRLWVKDRAVPGFKWRRPHHWLAYGFGVGLSPWAPGTVGTLVVIPFYLLLQPLPLGWYAGVLLLMFLSGVWACGKTARELRAQDPVPVVWDEMLGFLLAMTSAPPGWPWLLAGFVLFRCFDIFKPWPISMLDKRVPGGLGIILDDLAAGAMTWVLLQSAVHIL